MTDSQVPSFGNDREYVMRQIRKYEERNAVLQAIIDKGDRIKATATGFEQVDNRKCTCKSYGARRKDHADDCEVEIVTDPGMVITATKEMRLNDTYLDDLRASLKPQDGTPKEIMEMVDAIHAENKMLRARVAELEAQLKARRAITNGHPHY